MAKTQSNHGQADVRAWIKKRVDDAVLELALDGVYADMLVEAKPAWAAPFQIVIGKIREHDEANRFRWFICGAVPTDHLDGAAASTPREAAKYFALKWQLDAARLREASQQNAPEPASASHREDPASRLAEQAEGLYALVDDARLWLHATGL